MGEAMKQILLGAGSILGSSGKLLVDPDIEPELPDGQSLSDAVFADLARVGGDFRVAFHDLDGEEEEKGAGVAEHQQAER